MSDNTNNIDKTEKAMPHNGKLFEHYVLSNNINRAEVARRMHMTNTSVYKYAESPSLQMGILWKASLALNHNFVAELGAALPVDYVTPKELELQNQIKALQEQMAGLQKKIEHQQIEIGVYKNIVGK